ncbi:uncharacterized protein LOC110177406 [Drosophila serrata]|uniref:uncharacterized protein LOC110177406 n=1 Tax=Drosophila serrata TaxID=7274 RepID=UPI000A1D2910|nr:uncharacterized protein LOC110177406 [Drosophila serrata]KAH8375218.1 hypothetical protein KR200_000579 [Drosophila serrata]
MGVMQFLPRSLLAQGKLATMTLTRMYDTEKKLGLRRRRLELKKNLDSVPCYMALRRSENRCNQPRLKSMIDECMDDPCGMAPLPLDLEHYTPSDKAIRKYQRTWCESYLLPKKFVTVKKCYPNRPRRNLRANDVVKDCVHGSKNLYAVGRKKLDKLVDLPRMGELPCCKLTAPGCKRGRFQPTCKVFPPPSCCKKRRTQYPSFSECKPVGLLDPIPPCECERKPSQCDIYATWRRFHRK